VERYFFVTLAKLGFGFCGVAYVCKQPSSRQRQGVCFMSRHKGTAGWRGWDHAVTAVSPQQHLSSHIVIVWSYMSQFTTPDYPKTYGRTYLII